jgi:peptidoglycan hydrolase-like protein with peptidoglycan-binding domain
MPDYPLTGSVGKHGANKQNDTRIIQTLLKQHKADPGVIDGVCGKKTISAIILFQRSFLSWQMDE